MKKFFQNARVVGENVNPDDYHTNDIARGKPNFPASLSMLKNFAACPRRWMAGYSSLDSESKSWGRLIDCLVTTPKLFESKFAVTPETYPAPKHHAKVKAGEIPEGHPLKWNSNANECKAWEAANDGKEIILTRERNDAEAALERLHGDDVTGIFIAASRKQVHIAAEFEHAGIAVPVKALLDFVPDARDARFGQSLGDLKTVRSASPQNFQRQAFQMGWHAQAAFYLDLYNAATGEDRCDFNFVVQENFPPFEPAALKLSLEFLDAGRAWYRAALRLYAQCLARREWPGYGFGERCVLDDGFALIEPEQWMLSSQGVADFPETHKENKPEEFHTP